MSKKDSLFIGPEIFKDLPVVAAVSTRHGGVSAFPFESLNLGLHTADQEEHVLENRRRFFRALGYDEEQVAGGHQIHGTSVLAVTQPGQYEGYDAYITNQSDILLSVTIADCVPVLIYDKATHAVAAIHAGWRGTVAGIVGKALDKMGEHYGTKGADCCAYIGPCIDECSFEVGEEVAVQFPEEFRRWDSIIGKFFVDLKKSLRNQLIQNSLPPTTIEVSGLSTFTNNNDFFSYRKEKCNTGRMLSVIALKAR